MAKNLLLSSYTIPASSAAGTTVGTITNKIPSSTLVLIDDAGGRFQLVSGAIKATSTPALAGTYKITIKESNSMASQLTQVSIIVI
jgi:hypothetical protein